MSVNSPEDAPNPEVYLPSEELELLLHYDQIDAARGLLAESAAVYKDRPFGKYAKYVVVSGEEWLKQIGECIDHLNSTGNENAPEIVARIFKHEDSKRVTFLSSLFPDAGFENDDVPVEAYTVLFAPDDDDESLNGAKAKKFFEIGFNEDFSKFSKAIKESPRGKVAKVAPKVGSAMLDVTKMTFAVWAGVKLSRKN